VDLGIGGLIRTVCILIIYPLPYQIRGTEGSEVVGFIVSITVLLIVHCMCSVSLWLPCVVLGPGAILAKCSRD
jgi:hypothetical protein